MAKDYCKICFGISKEDVRRICCITPLPRPKGQGGLRFPAEKTFKGLLGKAIQTEYYTLFQVMMGPLFTSDAVLALYESRCEFLFFIGSAGLIPREGDDISLGSLVIPHQQVGLESIPILLGKDRAIFQPFVSPDATFLENFIKYSRDNANISLVKGASMGSFILEEQWMEALATNGIRIVDMECAVFYTIAQHIEKPALSLLFIHDVLSHTPWYDTNLKIQMIRNKAHEQIYKLFNEFSAQADI